MEDRVETSPLIMECEMKASMSLNRRTLTTGGIGVLVGLCAYLAWSFIVVLADPSTLKGGSPAGSSLADVVVPFSFAILGCLCALLIKRKR